MSIYLYIHIYLSLSNDIVMCIHRYVVFALYGVLLI